MAADLTEAAVAASSAFVATKGRGHGDAPALMDALEAAAPIVRRQVAEEIADELIRLAEGVRIAGDAHAAAGLRDGATLARRIGGTS